MPSADDTAKEQQQQVQSAPVEKEKKIEKAVAVPQTAYEFATTLITQVMAGRLDMSDARKLMHAWWSKQRNLEADPRAAAIEVRKQLERVAMIAGEIHTEFMVGSQADR
jgi:hypothetical protein